MRSHTVSKLEGLIDIRVLETRLLHRVDHVAVVGEVGLVPMVRPVLTVVQQIVDLLTVDLHDLHSEGGGE